MCLGQVIMALMDVSNGKNRHICYRDSKLTFLLRVRRLFGNVLRIFAEYILNFLWLINVHLIRTLWAVMLRRTSSLMFIQAPSALERRFPPCSSLREPNSLKIRWKSRIIHQNLQYSWRNVKTDLCVFVFCRLWWMRTLREMSDNCKRKWES